jgi:hypothetical protein
MMDATEIKITITTPEGVRELSLADGPVTIGRTAGVEVVVAEDSGLSRRHLTLRREGAGVRAEDERSTNGSFFNGRRIGAGILLSDGDEIRIGNGTSVRVAVARASARTRDDAGPEAANAVNGAAGAPSSLAQTPPAQGSSALVYLVPGIVVALLLLSTVALALYKVKHGSSSADAGRAESFDAGTKGDPAPEAISRADAARDDDPARGSSAANPTAAGSSPSVAAGPAQSTAATAPAVALPSFDAPPAVETPPGARKLYQGMTDEEKTEFIKQRAQQVAVMMGNRPYAFTPEAIKHIKFWLDAFARRAGNKRTGLWGGDTVTIVERGRGYAPTIIRAFQAHNVPIVIGIYIPFIETDYTNIASNNAAGAAGLFQFLGPTAEMYGVPAAERTNVDKMSVAAAKYFRDNIMNFGNDPMSVALSIAGYNRAPESVKRDLRNVLNQKENSDKERSFWTLIANQGILDEKFQKENVNYVPRFFAAAIFGENPWAFGVGGNPLSTYTQPSPPTAPPTR